MALFNYKLTAQRRTILSDDSIALNTKFIQLRSYTF